MRNFFLTIYIPVTFNPNKFIHDSYHIPERRKYFLA